MTSNTSPSPYVASASSDPVGYHPWNAFDGTGGGWVGSGPAAWLQIEIGTSYVLDSYSISAAETSSSRAPSAWTMEGSPDGSTWTTLDTKTGITGWGSPSTRTFAIATPGSGYQYFRINITANGDGGTLTEIDRLNLYGTLAEGTTPQTITFPATLPFSATSTSGLTVAYTIASGPGVVSGNNLTITAAGTIVVTATQSGNGTYAAATPVSTSFTAVDFAPHNLTSDISHPPFIASSSGGQGGSGNDYASFDSAAGNGLFESVAVPFWVQLDTGGPYNIVHGYTITSGTAGNDSSLNSWTLEGSNDGTTWTTLDTQTGVAPWGLGLSDPNKSFPCNSNTVATVLDR